MATDASFADYVLEQAGLRELAPKRMFGEYAFYLGGKMVAVACDNQLFVKPTDPGRSLLRREPGHSPFPNARPHFLIEGELDDPPLLRRLLIETADALPVPAPRKPRPRKPKATGTR